MKATFVRRQWENQAGTIATFYFRPHSTYRYEAGQYAVLAVPHPDPDSRGTERTMTLSSSPHEPLLSVTIRLYAEGGSSFKQALLSLQPDAEITIYEAMGDLVLPLNRNIPLVFIAGGLGIASFVGMIKWLRHTADKRDIALFYALSQAQDKILQQPFLDYAAFSPIIHKTFLRSRPDEVGSFTQASPSRMTAVDVGPYVTSDSLVYISGTEDMVESIRMQLIGGSVSSQQIVFDYFDGYASL